MLVQFHMFAGHLPGPVLGTRHKKALYRALDIKSTWGMRLAPMPWWVGEGWFRLRLFALVITSIAFIVCFLLYFMSFFPKAGKGKVTPASGNNLQILTLSLRPTGNISCSSIILQVTSKKISTYLFKDFCNYEIIENKYIDLCPQILTQNPKSLEFPGWKKAKLGGLLDGWWSPEKSAMVRSLEISAASLIL